MKLWKRMVGPVVLAALLTGCAWTEPVTANLPGSKQIEIKVGDQKELQEAQAFRSPQDYVLYVLPQFQAVSEEPQRDLLFYQPDDRFFVRIERLPDEADLSALRENAEFELKLLGPVHELKGSEIFDPYFRKARFFLHASTSELTKNIVVIQIDGSLYRFTMHLPNTETAEDISPRLWAMLKTIITLPANNLMK